MKLKDHQISKNSTYPTISQRSENGSFFRTENSQDQSGKMSMEEFNWAYATLQQEVEEPMAIWWPQVVDLKWLMVGGGR